MLFISIYVEIGTILDSIITSFFVFEDIQSNSMHLDSFSNRVEYHYIFREMSNEVGTFSEPVSMDTDKVSLALLNIIYFLRAFSN